jgi:hypothetical protein
MGTSALQYFEVDCIRKNGVGAAAIKELAPMLVPRSNNWQPHVTHVWAKRSGAKQIRFYIVK